MSFVAIDLGASSTRYVSDSGNISILPNNVVYLPSMEQSLMMPDSTDIESTLEVQIVKNEPDTSGYFPANVLMGIMAERHRGISERPNVNMRKYAQKINYISAIVACAVSKLKFDLTDDFDLYLAVPPIEVNEAKAEFNKVLVGSYTVTFPKYMGGAVVTFRINSVSCYAESYMASTSFFFNMNGTAKESSRRYLNGTVLSLDIGASTTDLAIIKNGRYLDKSGQTYMIGGNVARDNLIDLISNSYSMILPLDDAERVMAEGRLQQGNSYVDVSGLISTAKTDLAKQLMQYMNTYFSRVNVPIKLINTIVVSGGGSLQSQYVNADGEVVKTSEPMSHFVTQELTSMSSGTDVVEYGDEARFANVRGLFIKAKTDQLKKVQQSSVNVQPVVQTVVQSVAPQSVVSTPQSVVSAAQPVATAPEKPVEVVQSVATVQAPSAEQTVAVVEVQKAKEEQTVAVVEATAPTTEETVATVVPTPQVQ